MILHQFFEKESSTYTYLVASEQTREAVLIDPVASEIESYAHMLKQLNLDNRFCWIKIMLALT